MNSNQLIPEPAQQIILDLLAGLRSQTALADLLQSALQDLARACGAERALLWQVVGDQLTVTHEFAPSGALFLGRSLNSRESTQIVLGFLSRFPSEVDPGIVAVTAAGREGDLLCASVEAMLSEVGVTSRLLCQVRSRGVFVGFVELQTCNTPRAWSDNDQLILQQVAGLLSVATQQALDQQRIEADARDLKLFLEMSEQFRMAHLRSDDPISSCAKSIGSHLGFQSYQIYLSSPNEQELIPHAANGHATSVDLSDAENPFAEVFSSSRGKILLPNDTTTAPLFGDSTAMLLPLVCEEKRLGVLGMWHRVEEKRALRPQDRELGLTIAGFLAKLIKSDVERSNLQADSA